MNSPTPIRRLTASEHAAVFAHAKRLAIELRRQALDAFWSEVASALRHAWHGARRRGAAALAAAATSAQRFRAAAR